MTTTTTEGTAAVDPAMIVIKRVVFVGGLSDAASPRLVRAAFIPFGDIKSVDMPLDYEKGLHKGFAFVEYDDADDAEEAIFNMDGAELVGRSISVSVAQPNQLHKLTANTGDEAVWTNDEWFQKQVGGQSKQDLERQNDQAHDAKTLQEN